MIYSVTLQNARLNLIASTLGTSCQVKIYDGTPPATVEAALSGNTLLAELTGDASAFAPSASSGQLTANDFTQDGSANATGTPTFARLLTSGGTAVVQCTAGVGSGELNFGSAITAGQQVNITSFTIDEGND